MPEGGKSDLELEYETNNHRAHLSAYVLIAGLLWELVNAVIWFHGTETVAGMFAVLLIVGGVWGEVFFANKARIAGDKQLAQFEARTAEANARAAEAEQKAADARERTAKIEKLTAWRHVSVGQHQQLVGMLRDKAASLDVLIEWQTADPEAFSYAGEVAKVFLDAGVQKIRAVSNSFLIQPIFGLHAATSIDEPGIADAFARVGIPVMFSEMDLSTHLPRNETPPNLYIFVAPKPPPPFNVGASDAKAEPDITYQ